MMRSTRNSAMPALLALLVAGSLSPRASASGFQLREQSPSAQGEAFAGITAGGADISALFFNPAGATQFSGFQAILGGSLVAPVAEFSNGSATREPLFPDSQRTISGSSSHPNSAKTVTLPTLAALWSLSPDLKLGLSVNVPFGMGTDYNADFIGRYHARKSQLTVIDIAPSLAYRFNPQWSVGVAFVARKATAEISNSVDFGAIGNSNGVPGLLPGQEDGLAVLKGDKWAYGYRLGLTFQPTPELRLGLAHQAATNINAEGTITYTGVPAALSTNFQNGKATAELDLPATTSFGATYKVSETVEIKGEAALTSWSRFKELRVKFATGQGDVVTNERWHDTWFTSLGGTLKLNEATTLRAGLAFDQGAAEDATRTPRIPDGDRTWVSLGLGYSFSKSFGMDLGYTHIFVKNSIIGLSSGTTAEDPDFYRGNLNGNFKNHIDILALQARFSF